MEVRIALYMRLSMEDKENEEESNSVDQHIIICHFQKNK